MVPKQKKSKGALPQKVTERPADTFSDTTEKVENLDGADVSVSDKGRVLMRRSGVEVFPNKPLKAFDRYKGVLAFAGKSKSEQECIAYLCSREVIPRVGLVSNYRNLKSHHILKLLDVGVVDWSSSEGQLLSFAFNHPNGKPLLSNFNIPLEKMDADILMEGLIKPILLLLKEMHDLDMVHGCINPVNMFMADGADHTIILGECLSTLPSLAQHSFFEPIERALADSSSRGLGSGKDDLYSFGMCVALFARGINPIASYEGNEEKLLLHKIDVGSYGVVIGKERLPKGVTEFLRGVLSDDPIQRWSIDDALKWLEGKRLSPKQPKSVAKSARALEFGDRKYNKLRELSWDFSKNIGDAATLIEDQKFEQWIRRSFDDKEMLNNFEHASDAEYNSIAHVNKSRDRYVSIMCMALDPAAPLRYKGLSILPRGFGDALAVTVAKGDSVQPFGEMIMQQLFSFWLAVQLDNLSDNSIISSQFEECRGFLNHKISGYGMERVLYFLCPDAPCLSPSLKGFFVTSASGFLYALEAIYKKGDKLPRVILDRDAAAFLSVREPRVIDAHLGGIVSTEEKHQIISTIKTLAAIQKRFSIEAMPGICNWMASIAEPAVDMMYNRPLRKKMLIKINAIKDKGNLTTLLDIIDNNDLKQKDLRSFVMAQRHYLKLSLEAHKINMMINKRKDLGFGTGRQLAMLASSILSSIVIVGYVIIHFTS